MKPIIPLIRKDAFDDPAWVFELKYDGFRGLVDTLNRRILSRNRNRLKRFDCLLETLPKGYIFDGVEAALKKFDLATTVLGPDQRDQAESKAVRIATMHRAKGHEFDEVVLLLPTDLSSLGPLAANIQQLQ